MQFSQNFNQLLTKLYQEQESNILTNISKKVDNFFYTNEDISILLKNKHINVESIISKLSNETLNEILNSAVEDLFQKNKKFNIGIAFNYNEYIVYLLKELERDEEDGSILAIKFLKKLQSYDTQKQDIIFTYDLVFSDKEMLVGYCYSDVDNKDLEIIQKTYYEVILEDLIEKEIKNKKDINKNEVKTLLTYIINRQIDRYKHTSYFYINDFKNMLKYTYVICIEDKSYYLEKSFSVLDSLRNKK